MSPKISAIIPAYNRPQLLREAIASAWKQTGAAFDEIIVTDDLGSSETLPAIARFMSELGSNESASPKASELTHKLASSIKYAPNSSHLGGIGSWNRGLALATGDWVTVLHEDDLLLPNFLEVATPHLKPGVAAVAVRVVQGASLDRAKTPRFTGRTRVYPSQHFLKSAMTPFPGVLLSRECVRALGGFDPKWGALADYEFWYRVSGYGKIVFVDVPAAFYRVSEDQWTNRAWPEMLKRTLLLRRQIAREQFPHHPRWGKWVARFFTLRNASSYFQRYRIASSANISSTSGENMLHAEALTLVRRFQRLRRLPFNCLPSGWVWASVQLMTLWQQRASQAVSRTLRTTKKFAVGKERHA